MRLAKRHEKLPTRKLGESVVEFEKKHQVGEVDIYGVIGHQGERVHRLVATYQVHNEERVITKYRTTCGAETYRSFFDCDLSLTKEDVTCAKCTKKMK